MSGLVQDLPGPYRFQARGPGGSNKEHSMFLPHETVAAVVEAPGNDTHLLSEDDGQLGHLVEEWRHHPDVNMEYPSCVHPIGVFGDGMQYTSSMRAGGAKSVICQTINFLGGQVKKRSRRYTTCVITKDSLCDCGCEGFHTIQDVNSVFSWPMGFLRGKKKRPLGAGTTTALSPNMTASIACLQAKHCQQHAWCRSGGTGTGCPRPTASAGPMSCTSAGWSWSGAIARCPHHG